jgi:hypothetical protein
MTTYTWMFEALEVELGPVDDHTDIVIRINWRLSATDTEGHNAQAFGTVSVAPWDEDGDPWIEYSDLTESDVQGWVEEQLGAEELAAITARLDAQIEELATPTHETHYTMPWDTE